MRPYNLTWKVKNFDINKQAIIDYDVLTYRGPMIRKLKKTCNTKVEFKEALTREFMWQYWSRAEYELVLVRSANRLYLKPWVGCKYPEEATIEVTDDTFWQGFAESSIINWWGNEAKIDVWQQLEFKLDDITDILWHTRLPYERDHQKFHED
jgi:hypothetical protein